ncbi:MAG: O-antigen ligase family protein [Candidatus Komeilibacteria bacterium]|nr:O-antigen ligase family protein [Candidatus Komeilibacteria bacterium]
MAICWRSLRHGVYAVLLLLPTYLIRFSLLNIPFTLLEGMILLLFIIWIVKVAINKEMDFSFTHWFKKINGTTPINLIPTVLRWPLVFFLLTATLMALISPALIGAAGVWKAYFLEPVIFLLVFAYVIRDKKHLQTVINILATLSIVIFIAALVQKLTGFGISNPMWLDPENRRVTTFFGYPNANGLLLAPIATLLFAGLWFKENWLALTLKIVGFVGCLLTIWWAGSEGALVALGVGVLLIMLAQKRTRIAATALVLIGIMLLIINPALRQSLTEKLTLSDFSGQIRQAQWTETISLLQANPWRGGGLANYQVAIAPYHQAGINIDGRWQPVEIYLYPHNWLLNFWTELGLIGLLAFIWLLVATGLLLHRIYVRRKTLHHHEGEFIYALTVGLTAFFVTVMIHGLVDVPYFKNDLSLLFITAIAMAAAVYNLVAIKYINQ